MLFDHLLSSAMNSRRIIRLPRRRERTSEFGGLKSRLPRAARYYAGSAALRCSTIRKQTSLGEVVIQRRTL
jgi:hypothetical protein